MTEAYSIVSPRSPVGSFAYSLAVHGAVVASVILALNINMGPSEPAEEYVDMSYETFDAPPAAPPPKPIETKAEELQDEKSEVAGTQEKKEETKTGDTQAQSTPAPNVPYYKIKPKYPKAALIAGVEGWIMMSVDVNEKGEVENIRVLAGEQKNMFETEARRAVEQWKYRPFTDHEGKPVRKIDHQVRVDFKLTDTEESGS